MLKTANLKKLQQLKNRCHWKITDYFSGGIDPVCKFVPENIIVWMTQHDLNPERTKKHQRYILKLILKGRNISTLDGRKFQLQAGEGILIFPFQEHSNQSLQEDESPYETLLVSFIDSKGSEGSLHLLRNHRLTIEDNDTELLEQVFKGYKQMDGVTATDATSALIWFLSRQVERVARSGAYSPPDDQTLFGQINHFICENLDKPLRLKDIEEKFNISNSTLRRVFKANVQLMVPPAKMISYLRMYKAVEWLRSSSNSIAEIAEWCGYSDQFAFSHAFKKRFGVSPLQARKSKW